MDKEPTGKQPAKIKRLSEQELRTLDEIFPGFAAWYRATHDETGRYVRKTWELKETIREQEAKEQDD